MLLPPDTWKEACPFPDAVDLAIVDGAISRSVASALDLGQVIILVSLVSYTHLVGADDVVLSFLFEPRDTHEMLRFDTRVAEEAWVLDHFNELLAGNGLPVLVHEGSIINLCASVRPGLFLM